MKSIQISKLPEAVDIAEGDLLIISQKQNDGTYVSKKLNASILKTESHVTNVTSNYSVKANDSLISCNSTSDIEIKLYSATGSGKTVTVTNIGVKRVYVLPSGSDLVAGRSKKIAINETHTMSYVDISNGNWEIVFNDT